MLDKPLRAIHAHINRAAIDAIVEDANASWLGELDYRPGQPLADQVIRGLCHALLRELEDGALPGTLLFDHVGPALAIHLAATYGGMRSIGRPHRGGLAAWQERRAKDLMVANLGSGVTLAEVARECRLSVSHFSRAFRQSTGIAPHAWLLNRRVELAKELLRDASPALSEIALRCGFADQSHFTRVFTRRVGVSPGAWRRGLAPHVPPERARLPVPARRSRWPAVERAGLAEAMA